MTVKSGPAGVLVELIGLVAFVAALALAFPAAVQSTSVAATGSIVSKDESIVMGRGASWTRDFSVTYRYEPDDERVPQTSRQPVDFDTWQRLSVGSQVGVHYSSWRFLRLFEGSSYLDGTSAFSRLFASGFDAEDWYLLGGFAAAGLLGWAAYRLGNGALAVAAVIAAGIGYPVVVILANALLVVPLLFWRRRKQPGRGFGWLLLASTAAMIVVPAWRLPHPQPLPDGPLTHGTASIHRIKTVTRIWTSGSTRGASPSRSSGMTIGRPFYLVDLALTPQGASAPVHAVDMVDIAATSMKAGDRVPIVYSSSDPRAAQMVGVSRTYDRAIFTELMETGFGAAVFVTFISIPLLQKVGGVFDTLTAAARSTASPDALARLEQSLPADDPRRQQIEAALRARRTRDS